MFGRNLDQDFHAPIISRRARDFKGVAIKLLLTAQTIAGRRSASG